jgi:hypothetical protein
MRLLGAEYEDLMRPCSLILYPHRRGRGDPPYRLYWSRSAKEAGDRSSDPWARRLGGPKGRETRKLKYIGPLTRQAIFDARRWEKRDILWDFNRRAQALNTARAAVSAALDPALKALRYRAPRNSAYLESCLIDGVNFVVPPPPKIPVPSDLPTTFREALSSGWLIAARAAFAMAECEILWRNYNSAAPCPPLRFCHPEDFSDRGALNWTIVAGGMTLPKLSHRILERHRIPLRYRGAVLTFEADRRRIARLHLVPAWAFWHLRNHSDPAFITVDRSLQDAKVRLPGCLPAPAVVHTDAPVDEGVEGTEITIRDGCPAAPGRRTPLPSEGGTGAPAGTIDQRHEPLERSCTT